MKYTQPINQILSINNLFLCRAKDVRSLFALQDPDGILESQEPRPWYHSQYHLCKGWGGHICLLYSGVLICILYSVKSILYSVFVE